MKARGTAAVPVILLWLLLAASVIAPPYPQQIWLQHIPTVVALLAWPFIQRKFGLSSVACATLAAFLFLHIVGARYIYSYVPYDAWAEAAFGATVSDMFSLERNHYDRLVHFCFGFLLLRPVFEVIRRTSGTTVAASRWFSLEFILAASALYEIFEWMLTLLLGGADADAYNGQQGDLWDAQKDMALAGIGALLALPISTRTAPISPER